MAYRLSCNTGSILVVERGPRYSPLQDFNDDELAPDGVGACGIGGDLEFVHAELAEYQWSELQGGALDNAELQCGVDVGECGEQHDVVL